MFCCTVVLRFILNCPRQLPLRNTFTQQEFDNIFAHSYPAQAIRNSKSKSENWCELLARIPGEARDIYYLPKKDELLVCLLCFRPIGRGYCARPCHGCGNLVHVDCGPEKRFDTKNPHLVRLQRTQPDPELCGVCENYRGTWKKWLQSPCLPLPGDFQSDESEVDKETMESKLDRVMYIIDGGRPGSAYVINNS